MQKTTTFRFTRTYIIVMSVLLLLTNVVLGAVLMWQSVSSVTALVRKSMLNIVSTAAEIVNGDRLGALREEDVGGPVFQEVKDELSAFQNNIDIEYIYAVKQVGEDEFVFTVDADPNDPADYGEEVLVTDALRAAAKGTAMVDESPAEDEWGNFYSAYCPVFDSKGEIAGIIGVDFDSKWYDEQIRSHTVSISVVTLLAIIAGILIVSFLSRTLRTRFEAISNELAVLSEDIDQLNQEIKSAGDHGRNDALPVPERPEAGEPKDEIEAIGTKVKQMHEVMRTTLEYMQAKASTDGLTGVGNRTSYIDRENRINDGLQNATAKFAVVVFDINDLKKINDNCGHSAGDRIIQGAAEVISAVFGKENVYRFGGDEFLIVLEGTEEAELNEKMKTLEEAVQRYNEAHAQEEGVLSVSFGGSCYRPETDQCFHDVFVRADESMYAMKQAFHEKNAEA